MSKVVTDFNLYPRHRNDLLDTANLRNIKNAILSGARLPPIVVNKKDFRLVDGVHRLEAYRKLFPEDPDHEIMAELVAFKSDADMFVEAVRLNSMHGKPLEPKDRAHVGIRAFELKISMADIAQAMGIPLDEYQVFYTARTAETRTGETIPLAGGAMQMAGKSLTVKQEIFVRSSSGIKPEVWARQLLNALRAGYDFKMTTQFVKTLEQLKQEIDKILVGAQV